MKNIIEEVKENSSKLNSCIGPHDFKRKDHNWSYCKKCGGKLSPISAHWYMKGIKDAANANGR